MKGKPKKTQEKFIEDLRIKNPNIELIGPYICSKIKIKVKCRLCDFMWNANSSDLLYKQSGCPECGKKIKSKKLTKTHEEFVEELKKINSNIIPIDKYEKGHKKIKVKCKKANHEWMVTPHNLLTAKSSCPVCYGNNKKSHEEFVEEMKIKNNDIILLEKYNSNYKKINVKCNVCSNEWAVKPNSLLSGTGCKKCSIKQMKIKITKSHEEFVEEMKIINQYIEVVGTYTGDRNKIEMRCIKCNKNWFANVSGLLYQKTGCPNCYSSKGEEQIKIFLMKNNIKFITQKTFDDLVGKKGWRLRYDFYLPDYNILIEYDGKHHFKEVPYFGAGKLQIIKIRDKIKNQYAIKNDIKLIRISYTQFKNIKEILADQLKII